MTASGLDCLPTRKLTQQFAHQRRLANIRRETTNTDDKRAIHFLRFSLGTTLGGVTFKTPRASLFRLYWTSRGALPSSSTRTVKVLLSACPSTFAGKKPFKS